MMKRNPARAGRRVQQRVQYRPVRNSVASIFHGLRFSEGRCNRTAVQMITPDHDRRFDFACLDEMVDALAEPCAFAVAEPADPRRQTLEMNLLARSEERRVGKEW